MSQEIIEKIFEVEDSPKLIVKNIRGKILITPGELNSINIKVIKDHSSGDPENTIIVLEKSTDGTILAKANYDENNFFKLKQSCKVDFIIETPINTSVHIDAISSSVEITGLRETIQAKTIRGKIEISDFSGTLDAKTISGAIVGNTIEGNVNLDSVSGKIKILNANLTKIKSSTISGSTKIETLQIGKGPYKFKSISGKLVFIIPQKSNCSLNASSMSGRFKTNLISTVSEIGKNKWRFDLGGGGPEIYLKSISGGLRLLSSENSNAETAGLAPEKSMDHIEILEKIENGDISVDEAILEFS